MIGSGKVRESYDYSTKALKLGQEINSYPVKGLAYANLIWTCAEKKLLDQGIAIWQSKSKKYSSCTTSSP